MDAPPPPPRRTLMKLRAVVDDCLAKHLDDSAVFFADKLVSMSAKGEQSHLDDVFLYCQALFQGGHYRRALTVMRRNGVLEGSSGVDGGGVNGVGAIGQGTLRFALLAAQCFAAGGEWDESLAVLGDGDTDEAREQREREAEQERERQEAQQSHGGTSSSQKKEKPNGISLTAALRLQRGKAHVALENKPLALIWFTKALEADPFCSDAFDCLISNHMLGTEEERTLIASLKFSEEDEWLRFLYTSMGKKYDEPDVQSGLEILDEIKKASDSVNDGHDGYGGDESANPDLQRLRDTLPAELIALSDNGEVLLARAEWYYHRGDFQKSHDLCLEILDTDPFQLKALPVYLAVTVELRKKNELYLCAHNLVEEYPGKAIAWFAVGCYYYCVRRFDAARRFFSKATSLDNAFVPAWIGFGHAFAAQDESDQAMAAYRTATRLFPGCHLPTLCIGMEYRRANNLSLAEQFFQKALSICPADPLVHNELGVLAYRNKDYTSSIGHFLDAITLVPHPLTDEWEPSVVNVAHAYRKMNDFDAAIEWYERALGLAPKCASTHTALGFTHQLKGNFQSNMGEAIECYHRALSLKPDDTFAQEMLTLALIDQCAVTMPPYNFVSYEPLEGVGAISHQGGRAISKSHGNQEQGAPGAAPVPTQPTEREEIDEDDDMEMSP